MKFYSFILLGLLFALISVTPVNALITDDVVLCYDFEDETAATTIVDSVGSYDATKVTGGIVKLTSASCKVNNCSDVAGDKYTTASFPQLTSSSGFTIGTWIYTDTIAAGARRILNDDDSFANSTGWYYRQQDSWVDWFATDDSNANKNAVRSATSSIATGTWYYWMLICENGHCDNYLDNSQNSQNNIDYNVTTTEEGITMFATSTDTETYDGRFDTMTVWQRPLNSTDRADAYNSGSGRACDYFILPPDLLIENSTYNITSGIDSGNQTIWRTNQTYRAVINDITPTIIFDTNKASICAITDKNENLSTAMAGNGTLCDENSANATSITHTCTTGYSLDKGANSSLYIACGEESSGYVDTSNVSNSGELKVFVKLYDIFGTVTDALTNAVNNARVLLLTSGVDSCSFTTTNSSGGYTFEVDEIDMYVTSAYNPSNFSQKPDSQFVNVSG